MSHKKSTVTDKEKRLATLYHDLLCHEVHENEEGCLWFSVSDADDAAWESVIDRAHFLNMARVLLNLWNDAKYNVFAIPNILKEMDRNGPAPKMVDGKFVFDNSHLFKK